MIKFTEGNIWFALRGNHIMARYGRQRGDLIIRIVKS